MLLPTLYVVPSLDTVYTDDLIRLRSSSHAVQPCLGSSLDAVGHGCAQVMVMELWDRCRRSSYRQTLETWEILAYEHLAFASARIQHSPLDQV